VADPIHQFQIKTLYDLHVGSADISFTNSSMWMMIAVILSTGFLTLAMRRRALVPGRMQVMAESLYNFVAGMIGENIGEKGKHYFPLIFTLFIIVLMGNVLGMLPYSFTYTSHIVVTMALALMVFFIVIFVGILRNGFSFFSLFLPSGVPLWLAPIIVPLEVISFLARPLTLAVRLFANMMAGHLILKVFAGFSVAMLALGAEMGLAGVGFAAGVIPMLFNVVLIAFELLVALLHAYVFTVLSCIYLKDTVDLHH